MAEQSLKIVGGGSAAVSEKLASTVVNQGLLHHLVVDLNARKRRGTHTVKTRSEVAGGGAKPWRQKGTGRARAGSNSSPVWVGGGVAHGPKARKYGGRINKKEKALGLLHAVKARMDEEVLSVFKSPELKEPKTAEGAKLLKEVGVEVGKAAAVVLDASEETVFKSLRNIKNVRVVSADKVNVVDLLSGQTLSFSEAAWSSFNKRFEKKSEEAANV